ncbi:MAG TPA: hypothetical protein VKC54_00165 [Patescibacteria group bacterium]|nr:hypothetical protein [Patescibacteria group bacterium]
MIKAEPKNNGAFVDVVKQNFGTSTGQFPPIQVVSPNTVNISQDPHQVEVETLKQNKDNFEKNTQSPANHGNFWKTELRTSL